MCSRRDRITPIIVIVTIGIVAIGAVFFVSSKPRASTVPPATVQRNAGDFPGSSSGHFKIHGPDTTTERPPWSPFEAIHHALQCNEPGERERCLREALRLWGEKDPEAALAWAEKQNVGRRQMAITAVLTGAARDPATAVKLAQRLMTTEPASAMEHGASLVNALASAGQFEAALEFARTASSNERDDWLNLTFRRWAEHEPARAIHAASAFDDEPIRSVIFRSIVGGWADADLPTLARFAAKLPEGPDRDFAFGSAMERWGLHRPAELAEWINNLEEGPEFDRSVSWLVGHTDSENRPIDLALEWVQQIRDPDIRHQSTFQVLREWAAKEPAAARQYTMTASWITAGEREEFESWIQGSANSSESD